ncbi:MAG: Crp/Fnr family transcriptional regulator [Bacteroidota bacterium]
MESETTFLRYVPIFTDLPEESLQKIERIGRRKTYSKDEPILLEEDSGTALFVIISGKVKVSRSSSDGREVIITILGESDFFGEMAILDGLARSANVIATEKSDVFLIHRNDFLILLRNHTEVAITLLQELTTRLRNADMKIKALSLKDSEGKVATVLLQIAEYAGVIRKGVVEIEKLPVQQDLANMAGTSRETISRTLHAFAKRGYIELDGVNLRILDFAKFKDTFE